MTEASPRVNRPAAHRASAILAIAVLALACSPTTSTAITASGLERQPDGWRGIPLQIDQSLPQATFVDTHGAEVTLPDAVTGTPTLLFFGYTSCPDICPVHLATIASAMRTTGVDYEEIDVVFVTVDPDRDTPERIEEYLEHFDARMTGLYAEIDVVTDALAQLRLPGPVVEGADPRGDGDLIGHPAQVIGFDADGDAQRVWPFGARRSDWVVDLPRILEEWS